jgi:hypothetical protein
MTNPNLNMHQFNDVYEMKHNDVGMVPVHALHDVLSAEYLVPAQDIPKAFKVDPSPAHTQETVDALTEDVRKHGVQQPLNVDREFNQFKGPDPEHWLRDGSHRYMAAVRSGQTHVPVRMYVHPPSR